MPQQPQQPQQRQTSADLPSKPEYLTAADLARRYRTSTRSIFRWADGGLLPPGAKIGALRRWSRSDLEAWEHNGFRTGRNEAAG